MYIYNVYCNNIYVIIVHIIHYIYIHIYTISQIYSVQTCLTYLRSQLQKLLISKQMNSQQWRKKTLFASSSVVDCVSACSAAAETEGNSGWFERCRPEKLHSFKQSCKLAWCEEFWCSFELSQNRLLCMVLAHKQCTCPWPIWSWGHG